MALLFIDGFDHYATADAAKKYLLASAVNIDSTAGRRGGGCATANAQASLRIPFSTPLQSAIIGFAYKKSVVSSTMPVFGFMDDTDTTYAQVGLGITSAGALLVYRRTTATVLAQSSNGLITAGTWNYIEFKAKVDNSVGSFEVRLNGVTVIGPLTNQDTQYTANAHIDYIDLDVQGGGGYGYVDDLYIINPDSGSAPCNDFLGDVRIDALYPNADGATTQWTPSAAAPHYGLLDETAPNTTDYVSDQTPGNIELLDFTDLSTTTGTVYGVQLNICALKDDAGSRSIKAKCRQSGANYNGSTFALGTSYVYKTNVWEQDPATAAAWDETGVNSAQFGVETV